MCIILVSTKRFKHVYAIKKFTKPKVYVSKW